MDSLKLAQLMCSRLCHDLITPIGALSSGLEIMQETKNSIDSELMDLTAQSAYNAAQRLIYYRAAFGFSGLTLFKMPEKTQDLLNTYLGAKKIVLHWDFSCPNFLVPIFQERARILLNLVGLMAECAPFGGQFHVSVNPNELQTDLHYYLALTGELVPMKPDTKRALGGELNEDDITPHNVQGYLTRILLDQAHTVLQMPNDHDQGILKSTLIGEDTSRQHNGTLF